MIPHSFSIEKAKMGYSTRSARLLAVFDHDGPHHRQSFLVWDGEGRPSQERLMEIMASLSDRGGLGQIVWGAVYRRGRSVIPSVWVGSLVCGVHLSGALS